MPKFPALSAPGPSGERAEHLEACLRCRHFGARRRIYRALDVLTVRTARGVLPRGVRWLLNTQLTYLQKGSEEDSRDEDIEWLWRFNEDGDSQSHDNACEDSVDVGP
eukprot:2566677-Karenia_brevis.AAC.1